MCALKKWFQHIIRVYKNNNVDKKSKFNEKSAVNRVKSQGIDDAYIMLFGTAKTATDSKNEKFQIA